MANGFVGIGSPITVPPGRRLRRAIGLCGALLMAGCAAPLGPAAFAATTPAFDPVAFWAGHTSSWGVIENRDGAPTAIITTTTDATPEGTDGLHMVQRVVHDGETTVRDWHFRRLGKGQFEATANDLVGTARGSTSGRTLHWTWTLATRPGNWLYNVTMDQWMYLADDRTLMNRTVITKFGVRLAEVSEQFVRGGPRLATAPAPAATGPLAQRNLAPTTSRPSPASSRESDVREHGVRPTAGPQ